MNKYLTALCSVFLLSLSTGSVFAGAPQAAKIVWIDLQTGPPNNTLNAGQTSPVPLNYHAHFEVPGPNTNILGAVTPPLPTNYVYILNVVPTLYQQSSDCRFEIINENRQLAASQAQGGNIGYDFRILYQVRNVGTQTCTFDTLLGRIEPGG